MAALDFPDNPATGDLYGSSGTVWRWDGSVWNSTAGASGAQGRVAYAQVTANQGPFASGAITPATGLSVTWTASPSRTYRISAHTNWIYGSATGAVEVAIYDGASARYQISGGPVTSQAWGTSYRTEVVQSGLSGTVTRRLQVQAIGQSMTLLGSVDFPAFILVEDITYEGGSTNPGGGVPPPPIVTVCADVNAFAWNNINPGTVAALNTVVTPRSNGSKFHLRASLQVSGIGADDTWYYLMRGALGIGMSTGASGGISTGNASAYHRFDPARNGLEVAHVTMEYVDSPNTTSPITYSCAMNVRVNTTQAVYLNRRAADLNVGGISSLVVQEILP